MALTTLKSIEKALTLIDTKKQNLKTAFQHLQSRSPHLDFTWSDLDSYFTSLQSDLHLKLSALQTLTLKPNQQPPKRKPEPVPARPDLKLLCQNMDASGLRKYVIDRPKERAAIRVELADAFKHAPDAGSLVLDALDGFWDERMGFWSRLRTACTVLLEELMRSGVAIGADVRDRARALAAEWKVKMGGGGEGEENGREGDGGLGRLGYLQLLATYKMLDDGGYDEEEMIDCVVMSARYRQAVELCRIVGLESRISDVIQRLINKRKQLLALKFIFEFELTDDFPPVPLLKDHVMDSKKLAQKVRKNGKSSRQSLNDAAMKEISALKSVIKCIEDHGLESQYSKDELTMRIEKLEKEKADRKRPAATPVPKPQLKAKQPKQNGSKRIKAGVSPSAFKRKHPLNPVALQAQPSSVNRQGLLPDLAASYLGSAGGAYGITGPVVAADPYGGSSTNPYGLSGASAGFSGNPNPSASMPYPSEAHAQPAYYDRAIGYSGYDVASQYHHPLYYSQ